MQLKNLAGLFLAAAITAAVPLAAQTAGQDMKNAGHDTAAATRRTYHTSARKTRHAAHSTKRGTEKAYDKTKHGTEVAADTTARRTKRVGKDIVGDHSPTTTPHNPPPQQ